MTFNEYIAYFKAAATSNKAIAYVEGENERFITVSVDDVINALGPKGDSMTFCLEEFDYRPSDALSDNPRKQLSGAFFIIDLAKKGDKASKLSVLNNTDVVTQEFLSKIKNDQLKLGLNKNHPGKIKSFDLNSVRVEPIGPVFGNWYGWRTEFTINQTFINNLQLDDSKWLNDTKFTL